MDRDLHPAGLWDHRLQEPEPPDPPAELRYALEESISSLELAGVECAMEVTHGVRLPAEKNRAAPYLCGAVLSGCAGRRTGFRGFRKGAAQRAVFFSSGASGLFSRFSSGISSLLMMVSICSSFFTSSLGKRLFTRWTTVLR